MTENYIRYLNFLNKKLEKFFEKQRPYIVCKKGCAECCKDAQFPYTEIELKYLLQGSMLLDEETQNLIDNNIKNIKEKKLLSNDSDFKYDCPFLIDNVCSLYQYRGIVCRTFGLLTSKKEKVQVPFCHKFGLNYSNVIEDNKISDVMFKESGIEIEPIAFNIDYSFLTSSLFENEFNINFGEKKPLIDWLIEE